MAPKAKKEAPTPPKAEAKAKALKAKKTVLKAIHNPKKEICTHPPSASSGGSPNTLGRAPRRNKLDPLPSSSSPDHGVSHEEGGGRPHTCVHCGCQGHQQQMEQAVKKLCDIDVVKVNTVVRTDAAKKVYVQLAPDYDALDVATKLRSSKLSSAG